MTDCCSDWGRSEGGLEKESPLLPLEDPLRPGRGLNQ